LRLPHYLDNRLKDGGKVGKYSLLFDSNLVLPVISKDVVFMKRVRNIMGTWRVTLFSSSTGLLLYKLMCFRGAAFNISEGLTKASLY
jgi:hypothetical protein